MLPFLIDISCLYRAEEVTILRTLLRHIGLRCLGNQGGGTLSILRYQRSILLGGFECMNRL